MEQKIEMMKAQANKPKPVAAHASAARNVDLKKAVSRFANHRQFAAQKQEANANNQKQSLESGSSCSGEVPSENGEEDSAFKPENYMCEYKQPKKSTKAPALD